MQKAILLWSDRIILYSLGSSMLTVLPVDFPTIRKRTENATHEAGVEMTMGVADVPSMEASSMLTSSSVMLLSKASAAAAAAAAAVNTGRGHICDLQRKRDLRSTICRHS